MRIDLKEAITRAELDLRAIMKIGPNGLIQLFDRLATIRKVMLISVDETLAACRAFEAGTKVLVPPNVPIVRIGMLVTLIPFVMVGGNLGVVGILSSCGRVAMIIAIVTIMVVVQFVIRD